MTTSSSKQPPGNTVMVRPDGPLIARGNIEVRDVDGQLLAKGEDIALCRCGASNNKPFCDGSHQQSGFQDDAQFVDERTEALQDEGQPLVIQCRENAMLLAKGPMHISSRDDKSHTTRNKAALCRCGHSSNKPFCDAKHKQHGFKSG
jgi:CDGSH-type Zn-finger protein